MGTSHSTVCNNITFDIWEWCISNSTWLSAAHIPGKDNSAADFESRKINLDAEWKLNSTMLGEVLNVLQFKPTIDLFASRVNYQFDCYVSYKADPEAYAVDAFSLLWTDIDFYAFPPFSLILKILRKIQKDKARGILIVPDWQTQVWWPLLVRMMEREPVKLPSKVTLLQLPAHPLRVHPLLPKLKLLACLVSEKT